MSDRTREERIAALQRLGGPTSPALRGAGLGDPEKASQAERISALRGLPQPASRALVNGASPDRLREFTGESFGETRPLSKRSPSLQKWLAQRENAAVAHDDAEALSRIDDALLRFRPERGWMGDLAASTGEGVQQLQASMFSLGASLGALPERETLSIVAHLNRSIAESRAGSSRGLQEYRQQLAGAEGLGVVPAFFSSPLGAAATTLENLAFGVPGIAAGAVGLAAGATVGPLAAVAGLVAGRFAGGVATEMGAWINQRIADHGYDVTDAADLARAFADPGLMAVIQGEAARKGITTAMVDSLSTLIPAMGPLPGAGLARRVGRGAADLGVQAIGESVGEAAGQFAAVGRVDWDDAILEGLVSLPTSAGEVALGRAAQQIRERRREVMGAAQADQDRATVDDLAGAWPTSKLAKRLPAKARALINGMAEVGAAGRGAADVDPETIAARFDRETWDAIWTAAGEDPAAEAARILPVTGREDYIRAGRTGTFTVPLGTFVESYEGSAQYETLADAARWRPDGQTSAERKVARAGGDVLSTIADELARAGTLYQREADIAEQIARLDEEIEALETGADVPREASTGPAADPVAQRATTIAEKAGQASVQADPVAQRAALKAELDNLVETRVRNEEQGAQIKERVRSEAVAAGRPQQEAEHAATVYASALGAFASRWNLPVDTLASKFFLSVSRADEAPAKRPTRAQQRRAAQDQAAVEQEPPTGELAQSVPTISFGEATPESLIDRAIKAKGTTTNADEAGFILPDGLMLDFSGKRSGGRAGARNEAHRSIGSALPVEGDGDSQGQGAVYAFMDATGSVRVDFSQRSVEFVGRPSDAQIETVASKLAGRGQATLEMSNATGSHIGSITLDDPTSDDIRDFLKRPRAAPPFVSQLFQTAYHGGPVAFPSAGSVVDGLTVAAGPYEDVLSVLATGVFEEVGGGVRSVPLERIEAAPFGSQDERVRVNALAAQIKSSGEIAPLVVRIAAGGQLHVVEGQHRAEALRALGKEAAPAVLVREAGDEFAALEEATRAAENQLSSSVSMDRVRSLVARIEEVPVGEDLGATPISAQLPGVHLALQTLGLSLNDDAAEIRLDRLRRVAPLGRELRKKATEAAATENALGTLTAVGREMGFRRALEALSIIPLGGSVDDIAGAAQLRQSKRGRTRYAAQPDTHGRRFFSVEFLRDANASTFIHEMGHVFLFMLDDLVADPNIETPTQAAADHAALRQYLGVGEDGQIAEEQHELFARTFEAFMRDGKAPSKELRPAFAAFRRFLTRIYRSLRDIVGAPGDRVPEINADIRAVFDRLLATDEQIAEAQYELGLPSLPANVIATLSPEEQAAYLAQAQDAQDEATARADRDAELTVAQRIRLLQSKAMDRHREAAQKQLDESPAGQAMERLSQEGNGLDRAALAELLGMSSPEFAALVDLGVVQEDGIDVEEAAGAFGFDSGDALTTALLGMRESEAIVEREAVRRLRAENPELMGTRSIRAQRRRAVANEERSAVLLKSLRILRKLAKGGEAAKTEAAAGDAAVSMARGLRRSAFDDRVPTIREVREQARAALADKPIRDIRPSEHLSAARRWSRRVGNRARVGAYEQAADAQAHEILEHELHREATRLKKRAEKDRQRIVRLGKPGPQKTLTKAGPTYRQKDNDLRDRFNFTLISRPEVERRQTLQQWAAEKAAQGYTLAIPQWILDEANRKDWQSLTADELNELRSVFDGIHHIAKTKHDLLVGQRGRSRELAAAEMVPQIEKKKPLPSEPSPTLGQRVKGYAESFLAEVDKASYITRLMDEDQDGGPVTRNLFRPVAERSDASKKFQVDTLNEWTQLYAKHFDARERRRMDSAREDFGGVALTHEARLSVLAMFGSETGRQRLASWFTPPQMRLILESFTAADVAFVKDQWALLDRLFQLAKAEHERITGQLVKELPKAGFKLTLADGTEAELEGGYHPLRYRDTRIFRGSEAKRAQEVVAGKSAAEQFETGFFEERVEEYTGKPRLDRGVVLNHLLSITHGIGMRRAVIDAQLLLARDDMQRAINERYGNKTLIELEDWLTRVAADTGAEYGGAERVMGYLRRNAVTGTLAFRTLGGMKQLLGLKQTAVMAGKRVTVDAARRWSRNPNEAARFIYERSLLMTQRRKGTSQREINETLTRPAGKAKSMLQYFGFYLYLRFQTVADQITWMAGYKKAVETRPEGVDWDMWEKEAISRADQLVRDTQGGGQQVDMSRWEGSGAFKRVMTTYFTDGSIKFNQTRVSRSKAFADPHAFARFLVDMTILYFSESLIRALVESMSGDDDEGPLEKAINVVRGGLGEMVDALPVAREASGWVKDGYDYKGSAGMSWVSLTERGVSSLGDIFRGEGDARDWKNVNRLISVAVPWPGAAINDAADAMDQALDGDLPTALVGIKPKR